MWFRRSCYQIGNLGICGLLLACHWGCGSGNSQKFTPVAGKVTVNGEPLATGSVTFQPDASKGNNSLHIPVGMLDPQGNYKLMAAKAEGAPLGWYKVSVSAQQPIDPKNPYAPPKHLINPKFGDANTSGLAVEVIAKATPGAYDFQVTK
jgi:hypothetical protein